MVTTDDHGSRRNVDAHVLMVPHPSQPHIIPMLDLAYQVASCGNIAVTFVSFQVLIDRILGVESNRNSSTSGSTNGIHFVGIPDDRPGFNPPSEFPTHPIVFRESLQLGYNMELFVDRLLQERESSGAQGPTCLVPDSVHWWAVDVASKLSIPRYAFVVGATSFWVAFLSSHKYGIEEDDSGGIRISGLPDPNLLTSYMHFPQAHKDHPTNKVLRILGTNDMHMMESDGVLLNTCLALDSQTVDSLRIMLPEGMPLLAVGPLGLAPTSLNVSMEGLQLSDEQRVTNWLDQQPPLSVLYVNFGTTGMCNLTKQHVVELARGLESSQQRFLWVTRAPPDVHDIADALPLGFEERVKGQGLLLTGWAPQKQILAHPSTGGFLSSCGWNSTVESLSRGVPIIGWPSLADQPTICRYIEVVLKVAIGLPRKADFMVEAKEIDGAVRMVLQSEEGKVMRERAGKLKTIIAASLAQGGSSLQAVKEFADIVRHRLTSTYEH